MSEEAEIAAVLAQRGQGGSRKGRPTHFKSPFKGPLSASSRAVAQRDRKATFTAEEEALVAAGDADRSAKSNLMKKIRKVEKEGDVVYVKAETEKLEEKRYKEKKSSKLTQLFITVLYLQAAEEWLQAKLRAIHKKWDNVYHQVDLRELQPVLEGLKATQEGTPIKGSRAAERLFSSGGLLEKLTREHYYQGLNNLVDKTFPNKEAKSEWVAWVKTLTPSELAMVNARDWE
jgi:hypothetical protein